MEISTPSISESPRDIKLATESARQAESSCGEWRVAGINPLDRSSWTDGWQEREAKTSTAK
jgi:hypothetical protein